MKINKIFNEQSELIKQDRSTFGNLAREFLRATHNDVNKAYKLADNLAVQIKKVIDQEMIGNRKTNDLAKQYKTNASTGNINTTA